VTVAGYSATSNIRGYQQAFIVTATHMIDLHSAIDHSGSARRADAVTPSDHRSMGSSRGSSGGDCTLWQLHATEKVWCASRHGERNRVSQNNGPEPLLTERATLIMLAAITIGLVAGTLAYLSTHDLAAATLVGGGATGGGLVLLNGLVAG
jgi:hypothetical protein